jgi:SSS family transporter
VTPILAGVLGYVALQLVVGLVLSRRIQSEDDYLLAGRRLGYPLAIFSLFATWFGAETCIGSAGAVYEGGLTASTADPFGYSLCLLLLGVALAGPLWRRKLTTLSDLFRHRYSPGAERLSALILAPTSILWAAAQIRAFGQVLAASSELAVSVSIALAAIVVIVYTVSGGLWADAVTDLVQGVLLLVGLAVVAVAVASHAGGLGPAIAGIDPARLQLWDNTRPLLHSLEVWAVPICGSVVAQELAARVLASRSAAVAQRSAVAASALYLCAGLLPLFVGLVGVSALPGLADPEQILPALALEHLAPALYVLFAGALVSAILSTVDSALLAASALVSHNIILPLRPQATERTKVRVARVCVVVFGVVAWLLATHAQGVYHLVEQASAFGSSGVFVCVFAGIYTRVGGAASAYAALAAGIGVWGALTWLWPSEVPFLASLGAALLAFLAFSRVRAAPTSP